MVDYFYPQYNHVFLKPVDWLFTHQNPSLKSCELISNLDLYLVFCF